MTSKKGLRAFPQKLKRNLAVLTSVAIFLSMSLVTMAYSNEESTDDKREAIINNMMSDPDFRSMYSGQYKYEMERIVDDVLTRDSSSASVLTVSGSTAYYTVPIIKQATDQYCGFASMHQILKSLSLESNISGSTDYAKQTTLKNRQNAIITSQGGSASTTGVVSYMAVVMNEYLTNKLYYWYNVSDSSVDYYDFKQYTYNSLANNRPTIIQTNTNNLSYYNGTNYSHYIVIDYIDMSTSQMETADCCWTDAYRGYFMVPAQEAYNAAKNRYLICLAQNS